ncbi:MAG: peroxidase-related enzyme [Candidatus Eisenbacteria bacterium]|uniref:Peroxidase-related enzyme n=1 Tax=Eiseniibacteriota bacterium TaxID=2212470 RepID=A0A956M2G0_UNCEI|nr:peroxidase-related enzyme [Candidatus Eisenbacteria bacterium]
MSYLKTVAIENSSGMIRRVYDAATARAGEVAEIIQVMSLDAKSAQASMNLYTNLMKTKNALSPEQRELIATVVSNANECYYCTMSHARDYAQENGNKKLAEQVAYDYRKAALDPASKALCDYAVKLTLAPHKVNDEDLAKLKQSGFNDEMMVVIVQITSYFNYLSRVANALGVDPEVWMMDEPEDWFKRKAKDLAKGL